ncbi:hypothetical protein [Rhizobium sp. WW_1]|jgi:hypothetical protein|uniref:hypothetical protein n=1 Tax=Rhizobium sp. WW_1 TaxID=1907375 RepID=UPI00064652B4|nr:hypothetical protein [Rhizobium sp. WW_1]RKD69010.1 hypothetical protein BJ928_104148 [Rhizobium sp. WW_1]
MSKHKIFDDGGPAFSRSGFYSDGGPRESDCWPTDGMSLRDWFAGQALAGSLAGEPGSHLIPERLAPDCYALADAMIAARKGGVQ